MNRNPYYSINACQNMITFETAGHCTPPTPNQPHVTLYKDKVVCRVYNDIYLYILAVVCLLWVHCATLCYIVGFSRTEILCKNNVMFTEHGKMAKTKSQEKGGVVGFLEKMFEVKPGRGHPSLDSLRRFSPSSSPCTYMQR